MSKSAEKSPGLAERGSRFLRNINIIGTLALSGAALVLPSPFSGPLFALAGIDIAQAAFFDLTGRAAAKRRKSKH